MKKFIIDFSVRNIGRMNNFYLFTFRLMKLLNFFLLLFQISFSSCNCINSTAQPTAKNGKINLGEYDFTTQGNLFLNGEWEFYWDSLIESKDGKICKFSDSNSIECPEMELIQVPGDWANPSTHIGKRKFEIGGKATYRLSIISARTGQYSIRTGLINSAYRLILNGKIMETRNIKE